MAIIEDVLDALASTINSAIYPGGVGTPSAAGVAALIYPGWPTPEKLDTDIKAGRAHISVFPRPEERNVPRRPSDWQTTSINGQTGTSVRVMRQQEALIQITIWAPNPDARKAIFRVIDSTLSQVYRLQMPDTSWVTLSYRNSYTDDSDQKAGIFSKHIFLYAEYATLATSTDYVITENVVNISV